MAKSFLVPINMNGLEIQNFLVHNLGAAPAAAAGKLYFNTTDHKLYYNNGTDWVDLTASSNTTYTLTKSGSTITLTGSDGSTMSVTDDNTTYSDATTSASGLMSASDKSKLNGIAAGAEVNVQSDWNQTTTTADDYIKNKPELGSAAFHEAMGYVNPGSHDLPTCEAVADYVSSQIAAVDAMRFKGTVGVGGDVTALPTSNVKVGDTYRVITAGTYAGQTCEVGDLIIATATTPTWTVAQTNIDGAITSLVEGNGIDITGSGSSRMIAFDPSTAQKASSSTFGVIKVGTGLASSNGLINSDTCCNIETLASGRTTLTVSLNVNSYYAYDVTTGEEVVVDSTKNTSNYKSTTFTIASPYEHDIAIMYVYDRVNGHIPTPVPA